MQSPDLIRAMRQLSREADRLRFEAPVRFAYNPLRYAREPAERYVTLYAAGRYMTTYGLVNSDDLKHGVNQNTLQNVKIKCRPAQWQTI